MATPRKGKIPDDVKTKPVSENRDPITGEKGAHPVGVGVGTAVGGGVAGGAIGSAAAAIAGATAAGAAAGPRANHDQHEPRPAPEPPSFKQPKGFRQGNACASACSYLARFRTRCEWRAEAFAFMDRLHYYGGMW